MKNLNTFSFILVCGISVNSYANVDPRAYTINTPAYNSNSFIQGVEVGSKIAKTKREQAERLKSQGREDSYKAELKKFYDDPSALSRANLTKIMFLYPEFTDNTLKIIEAADKSGLLKD